MNATHCLRLTAATLAALQLAACSSLDYRKTSETEVAELRKGPLARPQRSITGFSESLRCMDQTLAAYGVREVPILVEDINDATKKISVGARDMLVSAMHEMSARSQAVKLITFGPDVANLANFHANAESKTPYASVPVYDIRGSISQLDENLFKKQEEAGITINIFGAGAAKTADSSILALDLSVISARDYSAVPGVKASNSVLIYKEGMGVDGEAQYKKFGINYGQTLTRSEGKAQAARTLIELAAIELVGKLAKVPYWSCLGTDVTHPEVVHEINTWLHSMEANEELVGYFQKQLALRGIYNGPIDGETNEEFLPALVRLRKHFNLSAEPVIDIELFTAYLASDHRTLRPLRVALRAAPSKAASAPVPSAPAAAAASTAHAAATAPGGGAPVAAAAAAAAVPVPQPEAAARAATSAARIEITALTTITPDQPVALNVVASADMHLYCYLQDAQRRIVRFFPNRFQASSFVPAGSTLRFPGAMKFQINAPQRGQKEIVACFGSSRELDRELPATVYASDFAALSVQSLDDVHAAFTKAARQPFALGVFHVESK
jgi:hypothetical protein